jgi:hypothetical protein
MNKKRRFATPVNDGQHLLGSLVVSYTADGQDIEIHQVIYKQAYSSNKADLTYFIQEHASYLWQSLQEMARNNAANIHGKIMEG